VRTDFPSPPGGGESKSLFHRLDSVIEPKDDRVPKLSVVCSNWFNAFICSSIIRDLSGLSGGDDVLLFVVWSHLEACTNPSVHDMDCGRNLGTGIPPGIFLLYSLNEVDNKGDFAWSGLGPFEGLLLQTVPRGYRVVSKMPTFISFWSTKQWRRHPTHLFSKHAHLTLTQPHISPQGYDPDECVCLLLWFTQNFLWIDKKKYSFRKKKVFLCQMEKYRSLGTSKVYGYYGYHI